MSSILIISSMNKLHDSLLIILHFGWKQDLGPKADAIFDSLLEYSKNVTDEQLVKEDWDIVYMVDTLLIAAMKKRKLKILN